MDRVFHLNLVYPQAEEKITERDPMDNIDVALQSKLPIQLTNEQFHELLRRSNQIPLTLNVTQAARVLGFDRKAVGQMCRRFELKFIPRGRKGRRIAREELFRWIRTHEVSNNAELLRALDGRRRENKSTTIDK